MGKLLIDFIENTTVNNRISCMSMERFGDFISLIFNSLRPKKKISYTADVKPILNSKCISCHGGVKKNGGLSFLFRDEALAVTESGKPAIIPGNARKSELIKRLHEIDLEERMPYRKSKLSSEPRMSRS